MVGPRVDRWGVSGGERYLTPIKKMKSELATALQLAQEAGRLIMSLRNEPLSKSRKEDRSLVTEADLRADQLIREGLSKAFPDHRILTEETGTSGAADSESVWLVDPLDGTKAYANGIPGFSVLIGLLKNEEPCLGVVVDPLEGLIYEAVKGEGAFLTKEGKKKRLQVSDRSDFTEMPLVASTGFDQGRLKTIADFLKSPLIEPINSVGIKVGLVVRQLADIYLNHHRVHYWDTCAPQVILEEAGGKFTSLDGAPLRYDLQSGSEHGGLTLATNGRRHSELVELLSRTI